MQSGHKAVVSLVLAALAAFSTQSALAQGARPYVSVFGGVSFAPDAGIAVALTDPPISFLGEMEFDVGWLAGVAAGFSWRNGLAIEGEFSFIENGLDRETIEISPDPIGLDGRVRTFALMLNGYYRFENASLVTPYIGAGAGVAFIDVAALANGDIDWFRANDTQFAYQAMAGTSLAIGSNTSIGVEYRFFGTKTPTFTGGVGVTSQVERRNHLVAFKLTHRLGE